MPQGLPTTAAALACAVLCLPVPPTFAQDTCGQWQWSNPRPVADDLMEVESAAGGFVVVGWNGRVLTSPDGASWTVQDTAVVDNLHGAAWNGTLHVAVGASGTILTSPDARQWTRRNSDTTFLLEGVRWDGAQFVAVGGSGTLVTSPDGVNWTARSSGVGVGVKLNDVAGGAGLLVAVGEQGVVTTSPDGVTWTARDSGTGEDLTAVAWNGSRFVATARFICPPKCASAAFLRSDDGITWTRQAEPEQSADVLWTGSEFVASGGGRLLRSADGVTWSSTPLATGGASLAWNGAGFVTLGTRSIQSSPDGVTWTERTSGSRDTFWSLAWNGQRFVVMGGLSRVLSSTDGAAWTEHNAGVFLNLFSVAWGNGRFVALGERGLVSASPDGTTWTPQPGLANDITIWNVIWTGSRFVGTGYRPVGPGPYPGVIVTSPDGVAWAVHHEPREVLSAAWNGTLHVAVGGGGLIVTSPDAVSWTPQSSGTTRALISVAWSGSQFVAVGGNLDNNPAVILTSPDGVTWTPRTAPTTGQIIEVAANGVGYVATTSSGQVFTSTDGITWTADDWRIYGALFDVDVVGGRFWAVGRSGTIVRRDCPRFADVPPDHWAWRFVEALSVANVTGGCAANPPRFCPDDPVAREQAAVFLLRSREGPAYMPPPATGVFADVPAADPFAPWIEELWRRQVTGGCGGPPPLFCPDAAVGRQQSAVFLLRTLLGAAYVPPPAQGVFVDVPAGDPFAPWIEDLVTRGISGGCAGNPPRFCPQDPVTRAQAAVFLAATFGLPLP